MTAIINLAIVGMPIIVMALAIILMGEWLNLTGIPKPDTILLLTLTQEIK